MVLSKHTPGILHRHFVLRNTHICLKKPVMEELQSAEAKQACIWKCVWIYSIKFNLALSYRSLFKTILYKWLDQCNFYDINEMFKKKILHTVHLINFDVFNLLIYNSWLSYNCSKELTFVTRYLHAQYSTCYLLNIHIWNIFELALFFVTSSVVPCFNKWIIPIIMLVGKLNPCFRV